VTRNQNVVKTGREFLCQQKLIPSLLLSHQMQLSLVSFSKNLSLNVKKNN
jgi:hypothetical protein